MQTLLSSALLLCLLAAPLASVAAEPAGSVVAAISPTCAPWDGPALRLTITQSNGETVPPTRIMISLWNSGLTDLESGKVIIFTAATGADSLGQMSFCGQADASACVTISGRLEVADYRAGHALSGTVYWALPGGERSITFIAPWSESRTVCG